MLEQAWGISTCEIDSIIASMKKNLTSQDIARLAGVSQSTVSRVVRNHPNIKGKTRDHVLEVIRNHGYAPSAAARSMKTNRSGSVAVIVANLTNPLYPSLLHLLVKQLSRHGLRTTVWEMDTDLDDAAAKAIAESDVDGVIFATAVESSLPQHRIIAASKSVVLMNRSVSTPAFDAVVSDNRAGGAMVARYFADAGRQRIGFISGLSQASTIQERERGFINEFERSSRGASFIRSPLRFDAFTYENGYQAIHQLLAIDPDVDSIFCTNDIVAIGALDGARAQGKRIPEDLWVIGYDDIPMAGWDAIGLTTVRQPLASMATMVVERLLLRIAQPEAPTQTTKLPNELIVRETTA